MNENGQIDELDLKLREAAPYIDDAGFTRKVVQQLPARRRPQSFRAVVLIGFTLLASLLTYLLSDGGRFINRALFQFATLSPFVLLGLAVSSGLLVAAVGLVAAFFKNRELQS
jgi:hypothetical protein